MKQLFIAILLCTTATSAYAKGPSHPLLVFTREHVLRVYDGDTFFINWPGHACLPNVLSQDLGIRLAGIDAPEMRSYCLTKEQKARERLKALEAQAYLEQRIRHGHTLQLRNITRDKYFRLDATLYIDGEDINKVMVDKGLAIPYSGTEAKPDHWCTSL